MVKVFIGDRSTVLMKLMDGVGQKWLEKERLIKNKREAKRKLKDEKISKIKMRFNMNDPQKLPVHTEICKGSESCLLCEMGLPRK